MSSPRGFEAGGIGAMGMAVFTVLRARGGTAARVTGSFGSEGPVGDGGVEVAGGGGVGRGKRNDNGLKGNEELKGGLRTLRYILNERSARFAWGT
jgi:hypothetical protein